jgi:hypothetical protein
MQQKQASSPCPPPQDQFSAGENETIAVIAT